MTNEIGLQSPTAITALQRTKRRRSKNNPGVPYAGASSGENARAEAIKILRRLGCEQIGFMDDFENREVLVAFTHRGRRFQLPASARGWATMYLKTHPWNDHSGDHVLTINRMSCAKARSPLIPSCAIWSKVR